MPWSDVKRIAFYSSSIPLKFRNERFACNRLSDALILGAMKLSEFLIGRGSGARLARAIGVQPQLMWQWTAGVRPVPIERCVPIERATDGAVTRRDLRPDDWQEIWPELATPTTAPATAGD